MNSDVLYPIHFSTITPGQYVYVKSYGSDEMEKVKCLKTIFTNEKQAIVCLDPATGLEYEYNINHSVQFYTANLLQ